MKPLKISDLMSKNFIFVYRSFTSFVNPCNSDPDDLWLHHLFTEGPRNRGTLSRTQTDLESSVDCFTIPVSTLVLGILLSDEGYPWLPVNLPIYHEWQRSRSSSTKIRGRCGQWWLLRTGWERNSKVYEFTGVSKMTSVNRLSTQRIVWCVRSTRLCSPII